MNYLAVKHVHMACVGLSIGLFVLRGTLTLVQKPWRQTRLLRSAPHVVDTLLLSSAIWLAWSSAQYPLVHSWLTAKVFALVLYIGLGLRALGLNTPPTERVPFFVAALATVAYIVGVAVTKSPLWGLV